MGSLSGTKSPSISRDPQEWGGRSSLLPLTQECEWYQEVGDWGDQLGLALVENFKASQTVLILQADKKETHEHFPEVKC